jgi:glycerate 2-kinase
LILGIIINRSILEKHHQNYRSLNIALSALEYSIKNVDPKILVNKTVKLKGSNLRLNDIQGKTVELNLDDFNSVYIVGAGKATARMTAALCNILNGRISYGAINVPYHTKGQIDRISITEANHPLPDESGVNGTKKIVNILKKTKSIDLVFVLISGGGSALLPLPAEGITVLNKQEIASSIMSRGASIHEINVVRKHLSMIKGGQLLRYVNRGCTVVSLILSDVIGDNIETIASGPTVPDSSTFKEAGLVLKKYHLWNDKKAQNTAVKEVIIKGMKGNINDTPKPGDPIFKNVNNLLIGNNALVCENAVKYLKKHRLQALNLGSSFDGEAKNFGRMLAKLAHNFRISFTPFGFVLGGETTVKLNKRKNNGAGGRNQETILAAVLNFKFQCRDDISIVCMGTDGIDGNTDAAGGLLTPKTISIINEKKLELKRYLNNHDSYNALKKVNSLIITGRTGTNVNDIAIICRLK